MAGKPVEKLVGGPFLYSGVNSVLLTSFMELQVIQLLERREACSAGQSWESLCFKQGVLYQLAVSRLNQRGTVSAGQEFCVWRQSSPGYSRSAVAVCSAGAQLPLPFSWPDGSMRAGWAPTWGEVATVAASAGSSLNPLGGGEPSGKDHAHDRNYFDCNFWGQRIQICLARFPSAMSLSSSAA